MLGENYPGFWAALHPPSWLRPLLEALPEDLITQQVEPFKPKIALDLGCGQGGMTQRMALTCDQVFGIENNFFLAATANHLLRAPEIKIQFFDPVAGNRRITLEKRVVENALVICGALEDLPFHLPCFDWIHCGHVLDLIEEPAALIRDLQHLLQPKGILSICTPWDFEKHGHFEEMLSLLTTHFTLTYQRESVPWLRFNHARRFILHEDWLWIGQLKSR